MQSNISHYDSAKDNTKPDTMIQRTNNSLSPDMIS